MFLADSSPNCVTAYGLFAENFLKPSTLTVEWTPPPVGGWGSRISANKGNMVVFSANKENLGFRQIRSGLRETRDWAARGGRKPGFSVLKTARNQAFPPLLVIKIPKFFAPAAQQ